MKKSHILSALVVAIGVGGAVSLTQVSAHELDSTSPPIIQKLVEKFGLNEAEVKAVFEEEHVARKAEMKVKVEAHLNQLVTEGTLTEAQKNAILSKHAEMESQRETTKEDFASLTEEERKAEMKAKRAELEAWAKEQGIDVKHFKFGFGGKGGHGGPRGMMTEDVVVLK